MTAAQFQVVIKWRMCGTDAVASSTSPSGEAGGDIPVYGLHRIPCSETGCRHVGSQLVYYAIEPESHGQGEHSQVRGWFFCPVHAEAFLHRVTHAEVEDFETPVPIAMRTTTATTTGDGLDASPQRRHSYVYEGE